MVTTPLTSPTSSSVDDLLLKDAGETVLPGEIAIAFLPVRSTSSDFDPLVTQMPMSVDITFLDLETAAAMQPASLSGGSTPESMTDVAAGALRTSAPLSGTFVTHFSSVAPPAPLAASAAGLTQDQVGLFKSGFDTTLESIASNVISQVLRESLPVIGDNLATLAESEAGAPQLTYITGLKNAIAAGFNTLNSSPSGSYTEVQVESALNNALTNAGIGRSIDLNLANSGDITFSFNTSKNFAGFDIPLEGDLGLPNLGLTTAGYARGAFGHTFNFTSGLDGSGFYLGTAPAQTNFSIGANVTLPNAGLTADLALLRFSATDNPTAPTTFDSRFTVTLKEPSLDGRLRPSELENNYDILDAELSGTANLNLKLALALGDGVAMPKIGTELGVRWQFSRAPVVPGDSNATFGGKPEVTFGNNTLELGSFLGDFAGDVLETVIDVTNPIKPILDVLTVPIAFFEEVGLPPTNLLDVFAQFGVAVTPEQRDLINGLASFRNLADIANGFARGEPIQIQLGSLKINEDVRSPGLDGLSTSLLGAAPNLREQNGTLDTFLGALDSFSGKGLAFPILQEPLTLGRLFLGGNPEFFTYAPDPIKLVDEGFNLFFPVLGPIGIRLTGSLGIEGTFKFGFDTQGLKDLVAGDFRDPGDVFNGFYMQAFEGASAVPVTQLSVTGQLTGGPELNLGIGRVGGEGNLRGSLLGTFDRSAADAEGKVRGETITGSKPEDLFALSGSLTAGLRAYLEIGIDPFSLEFEVESPRQILLSFPEEGGRNEPVLYGFVPGNPTVYLNTGPRAGLRTAGDIGDGEERIDVGQTSLAGQQTLLFAGFGVVQSTNVLSQIVADGGEFADTISLTEQVSVPAFLSGGRGDDLLEGGSVADEISGEDGRDVVNGRGGNDVLYGGEGNDVLIGGPGADQLFGGDSFGLVDGRVVQTSIDTASYRTATEGMTIDLRGMLFTGDGVGDTFDSIERFEGTPFGDTIDGDDNANAGLLGGAGNDIIQGHGGQDLLNGGEGDDDLHGGSGDDLLIGGPGGDNLNGGDGNDTVAYFDSKAPVTVKLFENSASGGDAEGDGFFGIERLIGAPVQFDANRNPIASGDRLEGSFSDNVISGLSGSDFIHGHAGNDVLYGDIEGSPGAAYPGFDHDTIFGGDGNDRIYGQADNDILDGGLGDDLLEGGDGNDVLTVGAIRGPQPDPDRKDKLNGGGGFDIISADFSNQTLPMVIIAGQSNALFFPDGAFAAEFETVHDFLSGSGNDRILLTGPADTGAENVILTGAGSDEIRSGAGNDFVDAGDGDDIVEGGAGADDLRGGLGRDMLVYSSSPDSVFVDLTLSGTTGFASSHSFSDKMSGFEDIIGSEFPDVLSGTAEANLIRGGGGDDIIDGREGNNDLAGGDGNDEIRSGAGTDVIDGGMGRDLITAGDGFNTINGGAGNDEIRSGGGTDLIEGGSGDDLINAGEGFNTVNGEEGNDTITGGMIQDFFRGGEGNDRLEGGAGANVLSGEGGNDVIISLEGDSFLDGGDGNDTLEAGFGRNLLSGGTGNDVLRAAAGNDTLDAGTGDDRLEAGDGDNTLIGGDGTDRLFSGRGVDSLDGGAGNDFAQSGAGNDLVLGGADNDILDAGSGTDRVEGGTGNDELIVGTLRGPVQDPERLDHLFGGAGFDTISADFSNQTVPMVVVAGQTQSFVFEDGAEARDFENVHDLFTGSADDSLRLDGPADDGFGNLLKTGLGNDIIFSGDGSDDVDAGDGDDFVNGGGNGYELILGSFGTVTGFTGPAETLAGGAGTDTISFANLSKPTSRSGDPAFGVVVDLASNATDGAARGVILSGFENIVGTEYGDDLFGTDGPNIFNPLHGGGPTNVAVTAGPDRINGRGGIDTVVRDFSLEDLPSSTGITSYAGGAVNSAGYGRQTPGSPLRFSDGFTTSGVEQFHITGASKNDQITGGYFGFDDILIGLGGNDTLGGNGGGDRLLGGEGNDVLTGQGSFSISYNGAADGHDIFDGGDGDDLVENLGYGAGVPIIGPTALFQLDGGTGFDTLSVSFSNQTAPIIWTSVAPTNIEFADGAYARNFELLRHFGGGSGNDVITQLGRFTNTFHTFGGNDTIAPGLGFDTVDGGDGNDLLIVDYSLGDSPTYTGVTGGGDFNGFRRDEPGAANLVVDQLGYRAMERLHFTGTDRADTVRGFVGDDIILGGGGNDVISDNLGGNNLFDGGEGDDQISGWRLGNDTLRGGNGSDGLYGSGGNDTLFGGEGNDILSGANSSAEYGGMVYGTDILDGGAGDDVILNANTGPSTTSATATTLFYFDGGTGFDRISADFGNKIEAITFIGGQSNSHDFADGTYFRSFEQLGNFFSGSGNDVLTQLGRFNNQLSTGGGNDIVNAGTGIDLLYGGPGDDLAIFDWSAGDDANLLGITTSGNSAERRDIVTNAVVDRITVFDFERFHFTGGSKADHLRGGDNADVLNGGGGNDFLEGGFGNDTINGGAGDDRVSVVATEAETARLDRLDGGEGFDTLISATFRNQTEPVLFDSRAPSSIEFADGAYVRGFEQIETFETGSGNDVITQLGRVNNTIGLLGGDDVIAPGLGMDNIFGGEGNDLLILDYSESGSENVRMETSGLFFLRRDMTTNATVDQTYAVGFERYQIAGTRNGDTLVTGSGNDVLQGGAGGDNLTAGAGDDLLDGGAGADSMNGGSGNDTYIVDDIADIIAGETATSGSDTVRVLMSGYTLGPNLENLILAGRANGVVGNSLANIITGNARNNVLDGGAGNDVLIGGFGVGLAGSQEVDRLTGGAGADTFVLGDIHQRYYDDRSSLSDGTSGYAHALDFTPGQGDKLQLKGSATEYFLGASPIAGFSGKGLFHDTDANGAFDAGRDELLAIVDSPEALTSTNTIDAALFV